MSQTLGCDSRAHYFHLALTAEGSLAPFQNKPWKANRKIHSTLESSETFFFLIIQVSEGNLQDSPTSLFVPQQG